jgi:NAD(P)-dependent dehydrogenase (short-subunit alcohol dehydrogenase family)
MDWSDKVVLITGASSGIGRGLALELARRGAKLGRLARGADTVQAAAAAAGAGARPSSNLSSVRPAPHSRLQEVVSEIESGRDGTSASGAVQALELPADVRDANAVRAAADRLRKEFGRIDLMIANAGMAATTDASALDPEDVAKLLSVNVIGAVNSVAAVLPEMIKRGSGQLVAISSLSAYRGLPKSAAYCASKASLSAFFESVRIDLIGSGVDVTIIHPGFIKTPLTAGRKAKMPYLMEVDYAVKKMIHAIEKRKKSYAFPWQLATIVRAGMLMPNFMYDWISRRNSFRE